MDAKQTPRWIRLLLTAAIGLGLLWRAARYFGQFPIWGDEAMLLLNILDRDYAGLTQHLDYSQVAPLLFLWLEKTALLMLGCSEAAVHLLPWLAGLGAFLVFWHTCRASFAPVVAGLAVGVLAVSYYPVRHASEVKPYAFDLLAATLYLALTLAQWRQPQQRRWLFLMVVLTPLAVFASYPSVFVAGAVSLVLLPMMRAASWTQRGLYAAFNLVLLGSFFLHYGVIGHHQIDAAEAERTRAFLHTYWKDAFPPDEIMRWPLWLVQVFTGNMLAYPIGANHGGSTLTFLLVLCGSFALWRGKQRALLALCWLPFGLNLVAAILGKYPFGDSARITLHLAPFICVLMAHGAAYALDQVPSWRTCLQAGFGMFLLTCGAIGIVRDLRKPYKTEHDREVRHVVRELAKKASGWPVLVCHARKDLLAEMIWYLRTEIPSLLWLPDGPEQLGKSEGCVLFYCDHKAAMKYHPVFIFEPYGGLHSEYQWSPMSEFTIPPENSKMQTVHCGIQPMRRLR